MPNTRLIERLIEDDYLHEQFAAGAGALRAAYERGRALRAQEAVQDRKLYDHVRDAAGSLTEAVRRATGKPEPKPKRGGRRALVVVVGLGVAALVRAMHQAQRAQR